MALHSILILWKQALPEVTKIAKYLKKNWKFTF